MNRIVVSGRMAAATLDRALYAGWTVTEYSGDENAMVAVLDGEDYANPDYMAGRLSSFGTVGVRVNPDPIYLSDTRARVLGSL